MFATTATSNKPTQTANNNIIITSKSVERQHASLSGARKRERWKKEKHKKHTGKRSGATTGVREREQKKKKTQNTERNEVRGGKGETATTHEAALRRGCAIT